jgi:hypothetical protein
MTDKRDKPSVSSGGSHQYFRVLSDIIAEEIQVRLSLGDQVKTAEDVERFASLAADAILDAFEVVPRTTHKP